jgi:hypothetical protein
MNLKTEPELLAALKKVYIRTPEEQVEQLISFVWGCLGIEEEAVMSIGTDGSIDGEVARTSKSTEYRHPSSKELRNPVAERIRDHAKYGRFGNYNDVALFGAQEIERLQAENRALKNLAENLRPGPISEALGGVEYERPYRAAVETSEDDSLYCEQDETHGPLQAAVCLGCWNKLALEVIELRRSAEKANKPLCSCGHDGRPGPGHQMNCAQYRAAQNGSER